MENKALLYAGIGFVFTSFILMIVGLVWESHKAKKQRELLMSIKTETKSSVTVAARDYSIYKTLTTEDGREMVLIPEGPFTMGSRDGDPDEAPEHQVFISAFYMDKKEVSQGEYARYMKMTKRGKPFVPVFEDDISKITKPELPAMGVSWNDADAYCKWAGKRLPTEAEWEKAGRGEDRRRYAWGSEYGHGHANINGDEDGFLYLAPPGSFETGRSPYGLYDMTGNVAEWVADGYEEHYYAKSPYRDPKGPDEGQNKVIRGGSWRETEHNARLSKRFQARMWRTDSTIGIRCAKDVEAPADGEKRGKKSARS